jgi:hypothetical protein
MTKRSKGDVVPGSKQAVAMGCHCVGGEDSLCKTCPLRKLSSNPFDDPGSTSRRKNKLFKGGILALKGRTERK